MSLDDLQAVLDASKTRASSFTQRLFSGEWDAKAVESFVNMTRNLTLAVVRQNGLPHAAPVICGAVDGAIHVTISPGSVLAACLERSAEAAFTVTDLANTLIGAGTAERVGRPSELVELTAGLDRASPFGSFAPEGWDAGMSTSCILGAYLLAN